jgi:hypothetical protein
MSRKRRQLEIIIIPKPVADPIFRDPLRFGNSALDTPILIVRASCRFAERARLLVMRRSNIELLGDGADGRALKQTLRRFSLKDFDSVAGSSGN